MLIVYTSYQTIAERGKHMLRLRELTPVRNAKGQYTGRYEYRLNPYALNSIVTYSVMVGGLISGVSILIAVWIGG